MTTPTLPQRIPGASLPAEPLATPPDRDACHLCRNGKSCDWHQWAPKHPLDSGDCGCCFGRYSRCRNPELVNSTPPAVHSIRRSNTEG